MIGANRVIVVEFWACNLLASTGTTCTLQKLLVHKCFYGRTSESCP